MTLLYKVGKLKPTIATATLQQRFKTTTIRLFRNAGKHEVKGRIHDLSFFRKNENKSEVAPPPQFTFVHGAKFPIYANASVRIYLFYANKTDKVEVQVIVIWYDDRVSSRAKEILNAIYKEFTMQR